MPVKKINIILLILLIGQLFLVALLYLPDKHDKNQIVNLLPEIQADAVSVLTITDPDGKKLSLEKNNNNDWMIHDDSGVICPAENSQVHRIVQTFTSLQSQHLVSRTPSSHLRLQVDEKFFSKKIELITKAGKKTILYLGSSPGPQIIHIRVQGSDNVYLASGIAAWELDVNRETWIRRIYVQLDKNRLQKITLENKHGRFTLAREESKWHIEGEDSQLEPETNALNAFMQQVTHLAVNDYLGKDYDGKALDSAVLAMTTDKETITVNIGSELNEKTKEHVIKSSGSSFYALAGSYQIDPLTGMKKEDLFSKSANKVTGQ